MMSSTAGADGFLDLCILILKDFDDVGFQFAIGGGRCEGRQIKGRMQAAWTFCRQPTDRRVRVRGNVVYLGDEAGAADYLDRTARFPSCCHAGAAKRLIRMRQRAGVGIFGDDAHRFAYPDVISRRWRL